MRRLGIHLIFYLILLSTTILAVDPTAYVINTSSETLSKINLASDVVTNNICTLGSDIYSSPSQIMLRDTLAYVVLSMTDEIQIINLKTESTAGWINFDTWQNPYWMAAPDDSTAYVTLLLENSVAKVDLTTRQVIKTTPVGPSPEGILIYKDRAYIAVTAYDFSSWSWGQGRVAVYDLATDEVINEINVGTNPQFLDIDSRGRIHVSCTGDYGMTTGKVYIIDPDLNVVLDSIDIGGQPGQISVSPDGVVFLAAGGWEEDGEVYSYNSADGQICHSSANPIYVDSGASGIRAFQDNTVFVTCFGDQVIRLSSTGDKLATYAIGDGPIHLDFNYLAGDPNGDWEVNVGDAVYIINYVFGGGPQPIDPRWRGDANGDGSVNVGDAVYLISYIFKGGPPPKVGST